MTCQDSFMIFYRSPKTETQNKDGFISALKRLLTNKLFMYNFLSNCTFIFAAKGLSPFLPKFLMQNFRKRASFAGFAGGIITIAPGIGILVSGSLNMIYSTLLIK